MLIPRSPRWPCITSLAGPSLLIGALAVSIDAAPRPIDTVAHVQQPIATFRTGVDLVRLSVTARDQEGRIVHDLGREDFGVFETGVRQELGHFAQHEAPISVVVLLDRSSSMSDERLMHAKDGVAAFLAALRPQDEALLISFGDTVEALGGVRVCRCTRSVSSSGRTCTPVARRRIRSGGVSKETPASKG